MAVFRRRGQPDLAAHHDGRRPTAIWNRRFPANVLRLAPVERNSARFMLGRYFDISVAEWSAKLGPVGTGRRGNIVRLCIASAQLFDDRHSVRCPQSVVHCQSSGQLTTDDGPLPRIAIQNPRQKFARTVFAIALVMPFAMRRHERGITRPGVERFVVARLRPALQNSSSHRRPAAESAPPRAAGNPSAISDRNRRRD